MLREKPKAENPQGESIEAGRRDGAVRSSVEAAVMAVERRGGVIRQWTGRQPKGMIDLNIAKPYDIPKRLVWDAWKKVKANKGVAGVDDESIAEFENNLRSGLYKIWNRMSSGSYMPPLVKRVEIAKSDGKTRPLGIPTVGDRVAQMVVKKVLEPEWDQQFHPSSFGYRPGKSAHDAVQQAKTNCWKYGWVIDLDIKGFFDNLDHTLLMKAVRTKTDNPWAILYIERWIKAGVLMPDGTRCLPQKGTPQGGVVSPLLANLFLHFVFDKWMARHHAGLPFERYADDIIVHCETQAQATILLREIGQRMVECGLNLHPEKTKVACCNPRLKVRPEVPTQFDFLGFTFRRRVSRRKDGVKFTGFRPGISNKAKKTIVRDMRDWKLHAMATKTITDVSREFNAQIRGWLNYYGKFHKSAMSHLVYMIDLRLIHWACAKYRKYTGRFMRAVRWIGKVKMRCPELFAHWRFWNGKMAE
jgi:group II intron reverse transcriptase/maturase